MPNPEPLQGFLVPDYDDDAAIPDHLGALVAKQIGIAVPRFPTAAQRDAAFPAPTEGQACWVAADNALYIRQSGAWRPLWAAGRDGTWQAYTPTATWALGSGGSATGHYARIGDTIHFGAQVTLGTAGFSTASSLIVGLPVPLSGIGGQAIVRMTDVSASGAAGRGFGTADLSGTSATPLLPTGLTISGSNPWAWGAGDYVMLSGSYRAA